MSLKNVLSEMVYDKPRHEVVAALNIVHSLYNRSLNIIHNDEKGLPTEYDSPADLLRVHEISDDITRGNPLRYLKNQFKFLSRKIAWIDRTSKISQELADAVSMEN